MIPETLAPDTVWLHPPDVAAPEDAARVILRGWLRPRIVAGSRVSADIAAAVGRGYAALRAAGEARELAPAAWRIAMDPVCLQAGMRDMQISHPRPPGLTLQDAESLADAVTGLLTDDEDARLRGLRLEVAAADRWYLSGRERDGLEIGAEAPVSAARGDLRAALPTGDDARLAKRLMTEVQMVLHAHPVNAARAAAGLPPVNSVWLHGAGPQPHMRRKTLPALVSDDALLRGIWRLAGADGACAPWQADTVAAALEAPGAAGAILAPGDIDALRALTAPLQLAVGQGRIRRLMMPMPGGTAIAATGDRWRLWRRRTPAALAEEADDAAPR